MRTRPPEPPEHLVRNAALERKLDRLLGGRPLVWIAAPPRSGKRTAVALWLLRQNRTAYWFDGRGRVSAEAVLADLAVFAESTGGPADAEQTSIVLERTWFDPQQLTRLDALAARCAGVQLILVDDRTEVAAEPAGRIPDVSASDFALSATAIASTAQALGSGLSPSVVSALAHHYGGNPALVGAAVGGGDVTADHDPDAALALVHSAEIVALATAMLGDIGQELSALLALAGEVPAETVGRSFGEARIERALQLMWERGLVAVDTDAAGGGLRYRLPSGVRERVRAATLPTYLARRADLHRHAAAGAAARGDLLEAARLVAAVGDARAGVELLVRSWARLVQRGDWESLLGILGLLGPDTVVGDPCASAVASIVRSLYHRAPVPESVEVRIRTIADDELADLPLWRRLTIRIAQLGSALGTGRVERARELARLALGEYESAEPPARTEARSVYLELLLVSARAALSDGSLRLGADLYDEALVLSDYEGSHVGSYRAECGRAFALALSGELTRSIDATQRALALRAQHESLTPLSAVELAWVAAVALIHFGVSAHPVVSSQVSQAAEDDARSAQRYLEVRARLAAGRSAEAVAALRSWLSSLERPARSAPLTRQFLLQTLGLALLVGGHAGEALQVDEGADANPSHVPCVSRVRPFALILQGAPREALAVTEECIARGHDHSLLTLPYAYLARAVAFEALDLPGTAVDALRSAVAIIVETRARIDLRTCLGEAVLPVLRRLRVSEPALAAEAELLLDGLSHLDAAPPQRLVRITPKERAILVRLAGTQTIPEIARALYLSDNTVKTHLRKIYAKLGVGSRTEAVDVATRWGLLTEDADPGQS